MYNPHIDVDMIGEAEVMSKGRLVKARLPDQQPPPNVSWFWLAVGNCETCRYYAGDKCKNPKISNKEFLHKYVFLNTCPEFEAGADPQHVADTPGFVDGLDVMKSVGLVSGKPSQAVEVIVDRPWTIALAMRAHREQSTFLNMAAQADSGMSNEPDRGEYVDLSSDLEPAAPPQSGP